MSTLEDIERAIQEETMLVIMSGNIEVLKVNMNEANPIIFREDLLPFGLKNRLRTLPEIVNTKAERTQLAIAINNNNSAIINWLASRTLLLSRANAKKLYQAFRLDQAQDEQARAKLAIACRALSVLDNYWVKLSTDNIRWDEVNLRHNSLNEAIAQIALHGATLSLVGSLVSPEFTTNGAYAKAWRRENGILWLYKLNDINSTAKIEVMVSNILDCLNVEHCHYEAREDKGCYVCACPSMTTDNISIADGSTISSFYTRQGLSPDDELIKLDSDNFYKMLIVDYLIANPDRHSQNWGVYYNPATMEILKLHPLFDHNNAFDNEVMDNENYQSHFFGKTLKENALCASKHVSVYFTKPISRDMFMTTKQFDTFMKRAKQLGIKEVTSLTPKLDI